jgi:hypothetical protein
MMDILHKQISAGSEDLGNRMIRFCISNESEDRDGDILRAAGCDFTNFAKNPQFLGFHNSWDFPLGTPRKWWVDNLTKKVYSDVYFPTLEELTGGKPENAAEKAKQVDMTYNMYKMGMLSAVSVGFRIIERESNQNGRGSIITKWELFEFSAVPLPCNQDALAEAVKSFDPSGRMGELFEDAQKKYEAENKSGARLSAATLKMLDDVKACHAKMSEHMGALKGCHEEMDALMKKLESGTDEEMEPDEDDNVLDIVD